MTTEEKQFVIHEVGPVRVTANGNRYLTCRTDLGRVAFWGSAGDQKNIKQIEECSLPCGVRAGSIPSRWAQHALWVPQTARVQLVVRGNTGRAGQERRAGGGNKEDTKGQGRRGEDTAASQRRAFDPYAVLGVVEGASLAQIRSAYRELIKQYHPDQVARLGQELRDVAHRKTQEINHAYQLLTGNRKAPV